MIARINNPSLLSLFSRLSSPLSLQHALWPLTANNDKQMTNNKQHHHHNNNHNNKQQTTKQIRQHQTQQQQPTKATQNTHQRKR